MFVKLKGLWRVSKIPGETRTTPRLVCVTNFFAFLVLRLSHAMCTGIVHPELPYRLVYKTHFLAPKLKVKRRGASCTEYEFTVFLINLGTRK